MSGRLGKIAYDAYVAAGEHPGESSVSGEKLPGWDGQADEIRRRWMASAEAVKDEVLSQAV